MYHYLRGRIAEKTSTWVVLDAGGVGFEVLVPLSTAQKLPAVGEEIKLLTHFVIREDAHLMFGFLTKEEQSLFKLLISVTGIGPKMAMTILSGLGISDLKRAIVQGSIPTLSSISGIGRKTAERLVIELREKVAIEGIAKSPHGIEALKHQEALMEDSLQALLSLGYKKQNAKTAIQKALTSGKQDEWDAEALIRESLKHI